MAELRGAAPIPHPPSARGGGVVFLDADDWLAPDALSRLNAALDASPDAVAASGPCAFADTGAAHSAASGDILPRLLVRNLFANCGQLLLRTDAVDAADGFLPGIVYGEDWEFCIRIALQGPFASVAGKDPVLLVRRHAEGAYRRLAQSPGAFTPCMDAIFGNPALLTDSARVDWRQFSGAPRPKTPGSRAASKSATAIVRVASGCCAVRFAPIPLSGVRCCWALPICFTWCRQAGEARSGRIAPDLL